MTVVLAAVYVPIGFQSGLTGALFAEFAFALVGAVTVSGIVALTLSPMLCSRLLKAPDAERRGWEAKLTLFHRPELCAAARRLRTAPARQPEQLAGDSGVRLDRARQHLLPVHQRQDRAGADRRSRRHHHAIHCRAELDAAAAAALFAAGLQDLRRPSGDRARLSARRARPVDRRHGVQAVGPARQDHQRAAAGAATGAEQGRRRARRRLPAAGAAGQFRPARSVRDRHHRSVRAPERRCATISAAGAGERNVHLSRLRSENRQSAIRHHHRSRQDRAARLEDERRRRLARRHARRRLCQLFQHQRPLIQGDPAGAAALIG